MQARIFSLYEKLVAVKLAGECAPLSRSCTATTGILKRRKTTDAQAPVNHEPTGSVNRDFMPGVGHRSHNAEQPGGEFPSTDRPRDVL
jgi:hypothetical protein